VLPTSSEEKWQHNAGMNSGINRRTYGSIILEPVAGFAGTSTGRNIERYFPDFVTAHPELPIRSAYDMRNTLSHGDFGVDLEIVWQAMQSDLPVLKENILDILAASK